MKRPSHTAWQPMPDVEQIEARFELAYLYQGTIRTIRRPDMQLLHLSQLQARLHRWGSARNSIVHRAVWHQVFENHEKYAYRQQKRPFLFIYTQQWLPKARFEKNFEGVYLKIFSTN